MNKKIVLSGLSIMTALALVGGATFAFFNDTETSTGNTFAAGDIDLKIDNTSYAIDHNIPGFTSPSGAFVASTNTTWELADLTIQKFFNFVDLKPGDYGEDTISVHVGSNDAWMCAAARVTSDLDNSITEPEDEVDTLDDNLDGTTDGDLDSEVNFAFWVDDGDNVLEDNEDESIFVSGPLSGLDPEGRIALSDSTSSGPFGNTPVKGGVTSYIGKGWCFGTMTPTPVVQDNGTDVGRTPLTDGTGFSCDGSAVGNISQTDSVVGDLQFYAEQSRNNPNFSCATDYTPVWPGV